ncbi:IucA/IucC family protein [Paenibacillus sp. H1-7]|uniref:IucA/IucC family protein n=1 Tax=Paenibacillus sp. H1-7 TaxID=2282849 RepID=UPI001EF8B024|nr:IucA/IucC family protein [Paenibacillus sp. H1-7]
MLYKQELPQAVSGNARRLAEKAALRALLNSYLRESGIADPRNQAGTAIFDLGASAGADSEERNGTEEPFGVLLPATGMRVAGEIVYYSCSGQHAFGDRFYLTAASESKCPFVEVDTGALIEALLAEVSFCESESDREQRCLDMREQIENSIRRTALYLEHARKRETEMARKPLDYIRSEQSLLYGHPFHPTPKSSQGFSDLELDRYAPELSASFPLHYVAVSRRLLHEEWVGAEDDRTSASVAEAAEKLLGSKMGEYKLLPLHPWQMSYVSGLPVVGQMLEQRELVDLGPIGPIVYPTSSVRTVWEPEAGTFYKLPIHVRITNFIRENTSEQLRRTMDAAIVLRQALEDRPGGADAAGGMVILRETGFRTVHVAEADEELQERIASSFAVVYRQAEALAGAEQQRCYVVAGLLELPPGQDEPLLFTAVRQSGGGALPDWHTWLAAYLKLSLLPLLRLFASTGISLEAHVQNSLLALEQGYPIRYYARDLEGISVNRKIASAHGWIPKLIPEDSPVLYEEAEAWLRLKYYYVVNHLGALIHVIGRFSRNDEETYWSVVHHVLQGELVRCEEEADNRLCRYIDDLLSTPHLPAKANFISRFQERGETPDYVLIPNPICEGGECR